MLEFLGSIFISGVVIGGGVLYIFWGVVLFLFFIFLPFMIFCVIGSMIFNLGFVQKYDTFRRIFFVIYILFALVILTFNYTQFFLPKFDKHLGTAIYLENVYDTFDGKKYKVRIVPKEYGGKIYIREHETLLLKVYKFNELDCGKIREVDKNKTIKEQYYSFNFNTNKNKNIKIDLGDEKGNFFFNNQLKTYTSSETALYVDITNFQSKKNHNNRFYITFLESL